MEQAEFDQLERGDIIRHLGNGQSFVVEWSDIDPAGIIRHLVIRSTIASNPAEWEFVPQQRDTWEISQKG
jgi:hypothetical protein